MLVALSSLFSLIRQAYLEIAMIYLHSSEHAHAQPINLQASLTADHMSADTGAMSEREDTISVMDDSSSIASGFTAQSSSKSSRTKRKVQKLCF